MTTSTRDAELGLQRLTTRLTQEAFNLLSEESNKRYRMTAARAPYGMIVSELIVERYGNNGNGKSRRIPPKRQRIKRKSPQSVAIAS